PAHIPVTGLKPCTLTYERSSAHQPGGEYVLTIRSEWVVETRDSVALWQPTRRETTTTTFRSRVHEIQTVVVPATTG
nr:hypothetical protein [Micromonospora sp. DSM 115978]